MTSLRTRTSTIVYFSLLIFSSTAVAQPVWYVAVGPINNAGGAFDVGNPAEPGVDVFTDGIMYDYRPAPVLDWSFTDEVTSLSAGVAIPAGAFDWGATSESVVAPANHGILSAAAAFALNGDATDSLRVRWTMGASNDSPDVIPPALLPLLRGDATGGVLANARVRLVDLTPGATYTISWRREMAASGTSATGFFECRASTYLTVLLNGSPIPGYNPAINIFDTTDQGPFDWQYEVDGEYTFTATPGFTCESELTIALNVQARIDSNFQVFFFPEVGLSTASTYGEINFTVEKVSPSALEICGDMNCDGTVDGEDMAGFMIRLQSADDYRLQVPCCPGSNADINHDGRVDLADVEPFAEALLAGGCP